LKKKKFKLKKEVVEKVEEEKKIEDIQCEECEENLATKFCEECGTKQCEDCCGSLHKIKKRKDHKLVDLKDLKEKIEIKKEIKEEIVVDDNSPIGKCLTHEKNKIVGYCKTCDLPLCTTCLLSNHDGHKKMDLESAKPDASQEYSQFLDELKQNNASLIKFKNGLNTNMNVTLTTTKEYFESIRKKINEQEELLTKDLNELHSFNDKNLDDEIKIHSDIIQKMEIEKVFVEQLKIKIDAKKNSRRFN